MPYSQVKQQLKIKAKGKKLIFLLQLLESAADGVFLVGSAAIILGIILTLVGIVVVASPLIYLAAFAGVAICGAGAFYIRRSIEKDRQQSLADEINNQLAELNRLFNVLVEDNISNQAKADNKKKLIENLAEKLTPAQEIKKPVGVKKLLGFLFKGGYQKKLQAAQKKREENKQLITGYLQQYSDKPEHRKSIKTKLIKNITQSITKNKKDIFTNRPSNKIEKAASLIYTGIGDGRSIFTGVRDSVQIMATLQVMLIGIGITLGFIATGPVGGGALLLGAILGSSIFFTLRNEKKQNTKLDQIKEETQVIKESLADYQTAELKTELLDKQEKLRLKQTEMLKMQEELRLEQTEMLKMQEELRLEQTEMLKMQWKLEKMQMQNNKLKSQMVSNLVKNSLVCNRATSGSSASHNLIGSHHRSLSSSF